MALRPVKRGMTIEIADLAAREVMVASVATRIIASILYIHMSDIRGILVHRVSVGTLEGIILAIPLVAIGGMRAIVKSGIPVILVDHIEGVVTETIATVIGTIANEVTTAVIEIIAAMATVVVMTGTIATAIGTTAAIETIAIGTVPTIVIIHGEITIVVRAKIHTLDSIQRAVALVRGATVEDE